MKKTAILILTVLMLGTLTACPSENDDGKQSNEHAGSFFDKKGDDTKTDSDGKPETVTDDSRASEVVTNVAVLPHILFFDRTIYDHQGKYFYYDSDGNLEAVRYVNRPDKQDEIFDIVKDPDGKTAQATDYMNDTFSYDYNKEGHIRRIRGKVNGRKDDLEFGFSSKEGCAYQLTISGEYETVVEQYTEDFLLAERHWYSNSGKDTPYKSQYYTYTGRLETFREVYDGKYDYTFTYTDEDFDIYGHCLTQYGVERMPDGSYEKTVTKWESEITKNDIGGNSGCIHTCDKYSASVRYSYTGYISMEGFTYVIDDPDQDTYINVNYSPFGVTTDILQYAFLNIYSKNKVADDLGAFCEHTVDCNK